MNDSTLAQKVLSSTVCPIMSKLLPPVAAFVLSRKAEVCRDTTQVQDAAEAELCGNGKWRARDTAAEACQETMLYVRGGSAPILEQQACSKKNAAYI
jgi:hypothetical protein